MEQISNQKKSEISFTFKKEERLSSKKQFEKLFAEGISFLVYPLKINVLEINFEDQYPVKAAFAVSKRSFRKAVSRNTLKRRMREAYRFNKHILYNYVAGQKLAVAFVYIGKESESFSRI
ncbi:MAG: ribonuclease P protein component, partial [Prolixibacteraceae bacterium]